MQWNWLYASAGSPAAEMLVELNPPVSGGRDPIPPQSGSFISRGYSDADNNDEAELEIRYLHGKIDRLPMQQWQRLLELQKIQIEIMEEVPGNTRP